MTEELIQVCADPGSPGTLQREWRALEDAGKEFRGAKKRLLVLTLDQLPAATQRGVEVRRVYEWLLG